MEVGSLILGVIVFALCNLGVGVQIQRRNVTLLHIDMVMKAIRLVCFLILVVLLTGCNPTVYEALSKTNNVEKDLKCLQNSLDTYFSPEIINIPRKHYNYSFATNDLIYSASSDFFQRDLQAHSDFKRRTFNGYVKCKVVNSKERAKAWGIGFFVITGCLCPMGHVAFEREYDFEVYDALGKKVANYRIKGSKNNTLSIYSSNNYDGSEVYAFKNALKKFYSRLSNDVSYINRKLKTASDALTEKLTGELTERDSVLLDLLNSGETLSLEEINKAIEEAPEDFVGWGLRIQYYLNKKSYNSALNDLEQYCKLNPTCPIILPYFTKADVLYRLGRRDEALESLVLAKAYDPELESIYLLEGNIFADYGLISNAIKSYEKAISVNPDDVNAISILNSMRSTKQNLEKMKEQEQVEEWARRTAAMNSMTAAYNNVSSSLAHLSSNNSYGGSFVNTPAVYNSSSNDGNNKLHYQYEYAYKEMEKSAKGAYEALTSVGYRTKDDNGNYTGGYSGMSSMVSQIGIQKTLIQSQQRMKQIRSEAA